jgi:hypothetical protein
MYALNHLIVQTLKSDGESAVDKVATAGTIVKNVINIQFIHLTHFSHVKST